MEKNTKKSNEEKTHKEEAPTPKEEIGAAAKRKSDQKQGAGVPEEAPLTREQLNHQFRSDLANAEGLKDSFPHNPIPEPAKRAPGPHKLQKG